MEGLTVREIKEALADCDDDMVVCFGHDYKDLLHTTVFDPVTEIKPRLKVKENSYYQGYVAVKKDEDGEEKDKIEGEETHTVVAFE